MSFNADLPHGVVIGHPFVRYEQRNCYYDVQHRRVDPDTGKFLPELEEADFTPRVEMPRPKVPVREKPPRPIRTRPPGHKEMFNITQVNLEESHWKQLQFMLHRLGEKYVNKEKALAYLTEVQRLQREELGIPPPPDPEEEEADEAS